MKHLLLTLVLAGASSAPVLADQALASDKHCMGCHAVNDKKVGPAFKDVATKYRGDKNAVDRLALKIRQGGAGAWGPVTMPPNPQVNEADAKKLANWVLGLK
ncbi:c-type cytochrome [Rhodoferax sp.]|uniref:c-type cytochrome n=1 Tax=Rhodoferax sp. TaxID=50421 RepID=UPI00374DAB99